MNDLILRNFLMFFEIIGCNFYGFCGAISGYVNIMTLVFISIERCLVIMKPLFAAKHTKFRNICKLYIFIWNLFGRYNF